MRCLRYVCKGGGNAKSFVITPRTQSTYLTLFPESVHFENPMFAFGKGINLSDILLNLRQHFDED